MELYLGNSACLSFRKEAKKKKEKGKKKQGKGKGKENIIAKMSTPCLWPKTNEENFIFSFHEHL